MPDSAIELASGFLQFAVSVLVGAAGVIIAFIWGFVATHPSDSSTLVKWSTGLLLLSIIAGILSLQFAITVVSKQGGPTNPTKSTTVAISFLISWVAFIVGCGFLAAAIPGGI
jgi:hypothetical protein